MKILKNKVPKQLTTEVLSCIYVTYLRHGELSLLTRRDRLKSAPYLMLKNIQRTLLETFGKIDFFKKKLKFFFSKKSIFLESRTCRKTQKGAIQAH